MLVLVLVLLVMLLLLLLLLLHLLLSLLLWLVTAAAAAAACYREHEKAGRHRLPDSFVPSNMSFGQLLIATLCLCVSRQSFERKLLAAKLHE